MVRAFPRRLATGLSHRGLPPVPLPSLGFIHWPSIHMAPVSLLGPAGRFRRDSTYAGMCRPMLGSRSPDWASALSCVLASSDFLRQDLTISVRFLVGSDPPASQSQSTPDTSGGPSGIYRLDCCFRPRQSSTQACLSLPHHRSSSLPAPLITCFGRRYQDPRQSARSQRFVARPVGGVSGRTQLYSPRDRKASTSGRPASSLQAPAFQPK